MHDNPQAKMQHAVNGVSWLRGDLALHMQKIEGWTVKIGDAAISDTRSWPSARQELQRQLQSIARIVPDDPLAQLRKVVIYVNDKTDTGCMAFHPNPEWLKEHKMDPDMATNIEIGNLANFVSWTYQQPWMVMHELAHAYDFRVLGKDKFGNSVVDAFNSAVKDKRYDDVLYYDGNKKKHYAMNNTMEFFAEMTEAYFGTNDIYPFVQAELKTYDPKTFAIMEKVWGQACQARLSISLALPNNW